MVSYLDIHPKPDSLAPLHPYGNRYLPNQLAPSFWGGFFMEFETTTDSAGNRVKKLPPSVVKDIELKNHARRLANLSPIRIKVRTCIACGINFESAGNRTCGCNTRSTGYIAGRENI